MNFFTKENPRVKVYLQDGSYAPFDQVSDNQAILQTENPFLIQQLRLCIQGQRGGVAEITRDEFIALEEVKKNFVPRRLWREELSLQAGKVASATDRIQKGTPNPIALQHTAVPVVDPAAADARPTARKL